MAICIILFAYLLFLVLMITGWKKIQHVSFPSGTEKSRISIVIPFRNEAENFSRLFQSLQKQDAAIADYEVIFVNDHSTDDSTTILRENEKNFSFQYQCLDLPSSLQGKKAALQYGIEHARHPVILSTDADTWHAAGWIKSYLKVFRHPEVQFAFGLVEVVSNNNLFGKMQTLEFRSLMRSAAASLYFKVPTMCNGANLAFRKLAFESVGAYAEHAQLASGDDEFLYHAIARQYPDGVKFLPDAPAAVFVAAKPDLKSFIAQRIRWASKWKHHRIFPMPLLAFFIALVQLAWLSLPFLLLLNSEWVIILMLICLKVLLEFIFLSGKAANNTSKFSLSAFTALQFLYAPYVWLSAICATFFSYSWKGRRY